MQGLPGLPLRHPPSRPTHRLGQPHRRRPIGRDELCEAARGIGRGLEGLAGEDAERSLLAVHARIECCAGFALRRRGDQARLSVGVGVGAAQVVRGA